MMRHFPYSCCVDVLSNVCYSSCYYYFLETDVQFRSTLYFFYLLTHDCSFMMRDFI